MSKLIPLSRGLFATVDDEDFDYLNQWKWSASLQGRKRCVNPKFRAVRVEEGRTILMHREIMKARRGKTVDHRDRNPLNNQRANLRVCTQKKNTLNGGAHIGSGSRFKGVCFHKGGQKWMASFKGQYIGLFVTEIEAARAYDVAAMVHDPEFCLTNFDENGNARDFHEAVIVAEPRATYSSHKGIHWHKKHGKWGARFRKIHIGYFSTEQEAISAREDFMQNQFVKGHRYE